MTNMQIMWYTLYPDNVEAPNFELYDRQKRTQLSFLLTPDDSVKSLLSSRWQLIIMVLIDQRSLCCEISLLPLM